jgi:ketosteroid isomerase-like protein
LGGAAVRFPGSGALQKEKRDRGVAGLAVACSTSVEDERFNLLARDREFSSGVKDMEKVLSFYVPDASLYLPGMPVATGAANIRSAAQRFGGAPGFSIEWEPTQVGLSASGDLGFTAGTYRMTTADPDKPIRGEYVEVWKKSSGDWKVAEHFFHPSPN